MIALEQPDTTEGSHHGHPDFRIGKSIFATLWPDQGRSVLRLSEPFADSLAEQRPDLYRVVSRSGGQGWLSVQLDGADPAEFRSLMETSRDHLLAGNASKKTV